jgi:hypothetical protein
MNSLSVSMSPQFASFPPSFLSRKRWAMETSVLTIFTRPCSVLSTFIVLSSHCKSRSRILFCSSPLKTSLELNILIAQLSSPNILNSAPCLKDSLISAKHSINTNSILCMELMSTRLTYLIISVLLSVSRHSLLHQFIKELPLTLQNQILGIMIREMLAKVECLQSVPSYFLATLAREVQVRISLSLYLSFHTTSSHRQSYISHLKSSP